MISFLELLKENKPFLGTFIQSGSPEFLEASAYAGFRFAAIDLEHAFYGTETLIHMIRAGEAAGLSVLARVPALDAVWIKKALDMGAAGIIIPNIDTAQQAEEAVRLCKFTPAGIRGACPGVRANRYGAGGPEYYAEANRNIAVIPLIESPEGVKNFDAILRVDGIASVFLGPVDLSVSLGLCGDLNAPEVKSMLLDMVRKAAAASVPVGALGLDPDFIAELFSSGLNYLAYGIDTILMYQKCRELAEKMEGFTTA
ncbi:MAG: aldolase/citrate lyase family protein [Candidatus Limivicinus sp.]